jgi:hypothetical protein
MRAFRCWRGVLFFLTGSSVLFAPGAARAVEWDLHANTDLSFSNRSFPQSGFGKYDSANEVMFLGGIPGRMFFTKDFRFEGEPQLRGFYSRVLERGASEPGYTDVSSPARFMRLGGELKRSPDMQWYGDVEKLNLIAGFQGGEVQVGRKPVSVGTMKVLSVWNKFSKPLPNSAQPNLIFGLDSASVRAQFGSISLAAMDIEGPHALPQSAVRWFEGTYYRTGFELHLMGSRWWQTNTAGMAFAADVGGAALRGELLDIDVDQQTANHELQAALGGEYAFSEVWSLVLESIYLEHGIGSSDPLPLAITSPFRPLPSKLYGYFMAKAQFSAVWTLGMGSLVNVLDGSPYALLSLARSMSDSVDLELSWRGPLGSANREFSRRAVTFSDTDQYIGVPSQLSLRLSAAF